MWKWFFIILAALYTLNPYDIFPDLIVGWGWLDDLIIWILLWRLFAFRKNGFARKDRFSESTGDGCANDSDRARSGPRDYDTGDSAPWDPYRVLEIDRGASADEIKHAYRRLANKYHPDKLEHLGDEFKILADKRFKEIQRAYQELTGRGD